MNQIQVHFIKTYLRFLINPKILCIQQTLKHSTSGNPKTGRQVERDCQNHLSVRDPLLDQVLQKAESFLTFTDFESQKNYTRAKR